MTPASGRCHHPRFCFYSSKSKVPLRLEATLLAFVESGWLLLQPFLLATVVVVVFRLLGGVFDDLAALLFVFSFEPALAFVVRAPPSMLRAQNEAVLTPLPLLEMRALVLEGEGVLCLLWVRATALEGERLLCLRLPYVRATALEGEGLL